MISVAGGGTDRVAIHIAVNGIPSMAITIAALYPFSCGNVTS